MSLLKRIAISNGNKKRKAMANRTITRMNQAELAAWHRQLHFEISRKQEDDADRFMTREPVEHTGTMKRSPSRF